MIANPIRLVLSMWILCFSVGAAHSEDGLAKGRRNGVELPACAVRRLGASRFVHPGEITAVTFVGDGARVASASGNAIYIWESATGNHCATLTGHKDVIRKIDSSHDGSLLASLSKGGRVILWDLKKKEQRFHIDETAKRALLCFSPDGKYLALAGHTVKLINPQTGKLTCTLGPGKRFKDGVRSLAFSPDGKLLAIADESDGSLSYWEVDQAKKIAGSEDIGGDRMIFTRDGKTLIAFWRGTPFFLNPRTGKLIAGLGFAQVGDGYCDVIALMPDGKHFFAAGSSFGIFRFKIKKSDSPLGKEVEVRRVRRFDEDRQYRDVTRLRRKPQMHHGCRCRRALPAFVGHCNRQAHPAPRTRWPRQRHFL
ncbi:MAG: hypothetical protein KatS3mg105_0614 [Gemmatales bacterium]|nr:MAG: hypothetical protein KatS3mg105_0614 [Gemmatales bacterium]